MQTGLLRSCAGACFEIIGCALGMKLNERGVGHFVIIHFGGGIYVFKVVLFGKGWTETVVV